MKLNNLELINYQSNDNKVAFILDGEVLSKAAALDGETLIVADGDNQIAVYAGYNVIGVYLEFGNTVVNCMRELDGATKNAIAGLEDNIKTLTDKVSTVEEVANRDVVEFAKMAAPAMTIDMTTTEICSIVSLLPEWKVGASYKQHQTFTYEGKVYRAAQKIPEAQEIYKPGQGTESLYTLIELAEDGVRVWKKPTDATNSFALNERAHYPTASDPIYVSKRDGNDSEPTKDAWWVLEDTEE